MKVKEFHNFNIYKESDFIKIQNELKKKIMLKNTFSKDSIRLIAGVDLSFGKKEISITERAV